MIRLISSLAVAVVLSSPVFADEYIVKYKTTSKSKSGIQVLSAVKSFAGVQVLSEHRPGSYFLIDAPKNNEAKVIANLMARPDVEYVVKNIDVYALRAPPTIQTLKDQWAVQKVNAEKAWALAGNRGSRSVIVAVIDTGVDYNHKNLKANAVQGKDFRNNDDDPMDETSDKNPGHGTHCAGIMGASGLVEGGTIGISPELSIMPLRFLGADGSGDLNSGIKAIDYAIEKGASVISASWGAAVSTSQAQPLIDAVKRASDAGVIMVMAAANDGKNNDTTSMYPANANFENTITVAASGSADEKPEWSNYGKAKVSIAAPGLKIMSTLPKDTYGDLSGTSMATPLVAGAVAFLKAQDRTLTGAQIRSLLQVTGAKVGIETACNCRIDVGAAMEALKNKAMVIVPAAITLLPNATQKFSTMNAGAGVTWSSSNEGIAKIDATGMLTAVAVGEATVSAKDAAGKMATSLAIRVAEEGKNGGGSCPLGDDALCQILCSIQPSLPFCQ